MTGAVQRIVDRIATEVDRPALLEDEFERLIAYSTHNDPVDPVRSHTILHRRAAPQVVDWLTMRGISAARSPIRIPGNSELGMLPRICFPVRDQGQLLGYLWFAEPGARMSAQDTLRATHAAADLRLALRKENTPADPASERVLSALRRVLVGGRESDASARRLHDDGYFQLAEHVVAVVIKPLCEESAALERAVACALYGVWQSIPPTKALQLKQSDHGVLLLAVPADDQHALEARLAAVGDAVHAAAGQLPDTPRMLIGVGDRRARLVESADSYREARLAARAGVAVPCADDIVRWTQLGIYQVVAQLVEDADVPRVVHAGLRALIGDPDARPLLETLETYLDVAGNAQVAARLLNLHRGSLYYRLQRVEQLAGASLRDGVQRLALHLELKMARLRGDYTPRHNQSRSRATCRPAPTARVTA